MVINVTAIVYAIPIVAIAVAALRLAVRRPRAVRSAAPASSSRTTVWAVLAGAAGLCFACAMFGRAEADLDAYRDSPSCRAGVLLSAPLDGACTLSAAVIEDAYRPSGRGAPMHVVLAYEDGRRFDVAVARVRSGDCVRGFRRVGDRNATVQAFRGRVVFVQTGSGSFETGDSPMRRVEGWAIYGILAGFVGTAAALGLAFAARPGRRGLPVTLTKWRA